VLFVVAIDPDSQAELARAEGEPTEVRVSLYGDQVDRLVGQLQLGVSVALSGQLHLSIQPRADALKHSRLTMVASGCKVLGEPSDQEMR